MATTQMLTRLARMQNTLLDHSGHVVKGLSHDDVRMMVDEIKRMRDLMGWKPLDMTGRYRRQSIKCSQTRLCFATDHDLGCPMGGMR